MPRIYLDNAATTRIYDDIASEMFAAAKEYYGNPASAHSEGARAAELIARSRRMVAECLNCGEDEIFFTSGGTESDNWALYAMARASGKDRAAVSVLEHAAVIRSAERHFAKTDLIPCGADRRVSAAEVERALCKDTGAVSVMLANNETGDIQPVIDIARVCRKKGVYFHTDAVQAAGHIPLDVKKLGADMISASAHKFHGPKGVGFLYVRRGTALEPFILGGAQQNGMRAGTENCVSAYGLALALSRSVKELAETSARVAALRAEAERRILQIEGAHIVSAGVERLPGILCVCFEGVQGESLAMLLDLVGIAVSSGPACHSSDGAPSRVLTAMGIGSELARGELRISISGYNTREEISAAADAVAAAVQKSRGIKA